MTVQQICTFFLDNTRFGIEVEDVQEIIRQQPLTKVPLAAPDICGLMSLRGQVIPVVDLPRRLGLRSTACGVQQRTVEKQAIEKQAIEKEISQKEMIEKQTIEKQTEEKIIKKELEQEIVRKQDTEEKTIYNIIVNTADDVVSFVVDDIEDVLECAIETLEPPPATLDPRLRSSLKGAYKLEQGFLLVLNTQRILESSSQKTSLK